MPRDLEILRQAILHVTDEDTVRIVSYQARNDVTGTIRWDLFIEANRAIFPAPQRHSGYSSSKYLGFVRSEKAAEKRVAKLTKALEFSGCSPSLTNAGATAAAPTDPPPRSSTPDGTKSHPSTKPPRKRS